MEGRAGDKVRYIGEGVIGNKLRDAVPTGDIGAFITTYHSARLYIDRIPSDRFQMLVLDEAHKLRNLCGTPTPPQVAVCFRKVLAKRMFKYVLMLTATHQYRTDCGTLLPR